MKVHVPFHSQVGTARGLRCNARGEDEDDGGADAVSCQTPVATLVEEAMVDDAISQTEATDRVSGPHYPMSGTVLAWTSRHSAVSVVKVGAVGDDDYAWMAVIVPVVGTL